MKLSFPAIAVKMVLLFPVLYIIPSFANGISSGTDSAGSVQFDPTFLNSSYIRGVDLNHFSRPNAVAEGEYQADIYLNGKMALNERIRFARHKDGTVAACLTPSLLLRLGVAPEVIATGEECPDFVPSVLGASARFDTESQRLDISLPQKYLNHAARDDVPSSEWDSGVAAAFAAYNVNAYNAENRNNSYDSLYVGLNSGINLGGWYFRHNGAWNSQTGEKGKYHAINTYVQHDITPLSGRLLAGQANTTGRLFDTLPFTGLSLFSDDQMLPQSRRGYAPEIRGIASSHARVTVRQGDSVIYETTVSPGEFVIDDLYPSGYGGDLLVTVREADGSEKSFRVPFSSVADLLRPGVHRYEVVAGKYRTEYSGTDGKPLWQAVWQQGLTNILTMYAGGQIGEDYHAVQVGAAFDTPLGAVSVDGTHSDTRAGLNSQRGESYRISYNKLIQETSSNIALAAYRFSTKDYLDFASAMQYLDLYHHQEWLGSVYREKERFVLSLQQGLGDHLGSLYLSNLWQEAWGVNGWQQQYTAGYSNNWGRLNYSLTLNRARQLQTGKFENTWMLTLSLPLGETSPVTMSAGLNRDSAGRYAEQAGLSGALGEHNQFSWGLSGAHGSYTGSSGNTSVQYRSSLATIGAGASVSKDSRTLSGNLSGAVVAHPRGVTLTPYIADSYVVVSAPGAAGAQLPQYSDVTLDHWGNAAVPVWSPYSRNEVSLDPKGIPSSVELDETSQYTVPRSGAVTLATFKTHHGYPLLLSPAGSASLPFGSNVTDKSGTSVGLVSQGGDLYVRVPDEEGKLFVTWHDGDKARTCVVPYAVRANEQSLPLIRKTYFCN
ncbi:TPA: fimbria/pilus outer membrane usher protein [Enterobacter hormaechei]